MAHLFQVGDAAVVAKRGPIIGPCGLKHSGADNPPPNVALKIVEIGPSYGRNGIKPCDCLNVTFEDGSRSMLERLRPVLPDKIEKCEEEFLTLLTKKKDKTNV